MSLMLSSRRKTVAAQIRELQRDEKKRLADIKREYRAKREMALLADEVGRRLVRAGVFTSEGWERARRGLITDCMPDFEVDAWSLNDGNVLPARVKDGRTVLWATAQALNCKLEKDHVGAVSVIDTGLHYARVTVWLNVAGPLVPETDDGLAERLNKARVRIQYDLYRALPEDGSPVVLGRSMSRDGKTVECRLVTKHQDSTYLAVECHKAE